MVQVDKITKSYGSRTVLSDVSFHLGKNERCALAGRNGSGKSTLLKILMGYEEADSGTFIRPKDLRVGALPQHLHFTKKTLLEEAVLGLPEYLKDDHYRVEMLLEGIGFTESDFHKSPDSFSGGYQLRLALCKVLAGEPELLLLDEPTNYLDILAIRWLESFLSTWEGQILFVSHDRSFVNKVCTHVLGIRRSEVNKVTGNLDDYEKMMDIYEDTHEKTREKREKKKQDMLAFADRFGAKASKAKQAQSKLKAVEKMETMVVLKKEPSIDFRFNYKQTPNRVLLTAKDMCFGYDLAKPLIKNVNFSIERKERIAIIGKNGSGKSTLMRLLLGDLPMQNGSLEINSNAEIAYFGQTNIDRLSPANTIVDELTKAFPSVDYGKIRAACGAMLFSGDDAKKSISVLSGGEKSRVLLAKILLTPANILLLDEPTHHLDMESVEALIKAIQVFDGAVVLVSHDESALRQFNADKLVICHSTRQETFLGNYDLFLEKRGWEEEIERVNPVEEAKKISQEKTKEQLQELRNLKKEISSIEKKIEFAEKNKKKLEETLAGNPSADGTIFRQYEEMSLKLDGHYRDLQTLLSKEEALQ